MTAIIVSFDRPVSFGRADRIQRDLVSARIDDAIPDVVLMLEHKPVVTLGRRAQVRHMRVTREALAAHGIDFAVASRGGDATYHAPGQLVVYPILKLDATTAGAHGYLHGLEEVAIRTAAAFGVNAFRRPGLSGAWAPSGKIAAIGFRLRHWVTQHGMSFNVNLDLSGFDLIVPCGLAGEPVSSLKQVLGDACPPVSVVADRMAAAVETAFRRPLRRFGSNEATGIPGIDRAVRAD